MAQTINIGTKINLQDLLQSRLLIQANSGGGKSVLARVIIEESFGIVPFIIMDIEGEYYTLKEKFGDVLVIGGQHADVPLSMNSVKRLPQEIIGNRLSVIIDTSDLQMSDRILYAKQFLETMMDLSKDYWINYLVFLEEAHKLCGEQDKQASAPAVKDLMSRGRKRGYCGVLITQRISKLHKDAAAECNNKFIGRTFLDIDLDRAAKELALSSAADKMKIRDLSPGSFYAFGTSIEPHHVHEVKIKLPKTKIPKAGVDLNIKPKAPTEKVKALLVKLNDLPAEGNKNAKSGMNLQDSGIRSTELQKKYDELKFAYDDMNGHYKEACRERDKYFNSLVEAERKLMEIGHIIDGIQKTVQEKPIVRQPVTSPVYNKPPAPQKTVHPFNPPNSSELGKCSMAILQFLTNYPDRSFSRVQVAVGSGYSHTSSGFANSVSELNTKSLIIKEGTRLRINLEVAKSTIGEIIPVKYSLDAFRSKLSKCEGEILEVLINHRGHFLTKDEIADQTPSRYSVTSSGFANAISRLNTLEMIRKEGGRIGLNQELLDI